MNLPNGKTKELATELLTKLETTKDHDHKISKMAYYLAYIYQRGWEDGMSEGTEHAEQLQKYREKYK